MVDTFVVVLLDMAVTIVKKLHVAVIHVLIMAHVPISVLLISAHVLLDTVEPIVR